MLQKDILDMIQRYIRASYAWQDAGDTEEIVDGPGKEMIDLENTILCRFGLPPQTLEYSEMMQQEGFSLNHIERRSRRLYGKLQQAATEWLLSPVQPDPERLREAKLAYTPSQDVLPRMGFWNTRYAGFLYYDLYLTGEISEAELLQGLRAEKRWEDQFGHSVPHHSDVLEKALPELQQAEIPFLSDYKTYLSGMGHA